MSTRECNKMSISPVKRLILETMWMIDKPAKATEIAKDTGVSFPSVMMHIIGLTKMGYLKTAEKGFYVITEKGKKTLALPEVDKEKAIEISKYLPAEKSFQFYADIGKPLNIHASSLGDFLDKIKSIDTSSIEFHINRGDFEAWFTMLGDSELARKALLVKEQKMCGEGLREKLYEIVKNRCEELARVRGVQLYPNDSGDVKLA
jgi:DNA-binding transcriptional ArsR family regulator